LLVACCLFLVLALTGTTSEGEPTPHVLENNL
jgi:hypothetical protein